jgi:hypothetical protein
MRTWTRTLNVDDAHVLLALAEPGLPVDAWAARAHAALARLDLARKAEIVRLVRDDLLGLDAGAERIAAGTLLRAYRAAPAAAQVGLVSAWWALSHPLTLHATDGVVAPALAARRSSIPLEVLDSLVARSIASDSGESIRKTRTTLTGALEDVGAIVTRGTGRYRSIATARGRPHPLVFAALVTRDVEERGAGGLHLDDLPRWLPVRLTLCDEDHARECVAAAVGAGVLRRDGAGRISPSPP